MTIDFKNHSLLGAGSLSPNNTGFSSNKVNPQQIQNSLMSIWNQVNSKYIDPKYPQNEEYGMAPAGVIKSIFSPFTPNLRPVPNTTLPQVGNTANTNVMREPLGNLMEAHSQYGRMYPDGYKPLPNRGDKRMFYNTTTGDVHEIVGEGNDRKSIRTQYNIKTNPLPEQIPQKLNLRKKMLLNRNIQLPSYDSLK